MSRFVGPAVSSDLLSAMFLTLLLWILFSEVMITALSCLIAQLLLKLGFLSLLTCTEAGCPILETL